MRNTSLLAVLALAILAPADPVSTQAASAPPVARTVEGGNRPERLEWLQDAGFGMFIHWSLDSQVGSVISHTLVGASPEYIQWFIEELPQTFNPQRWDPEEIAILARLAGMKYVVLTAKHHSGFCLWDTATTDFKITNTPYGKDILKAYVAALRRHGLAVGLYYSPEDFVWLHRHGYAIRRRAMEVDPNSDPAYTAFIRAQVTELFREYGPIDVLFIDGEGEVPTKEVAWRLQPDCLITRGAIETPEQHVPGRAPDGAWESNLTMGTQWQYKPTNDEYKSGQRVIEILIETRAKGGALLLNVGPKPNGELPKEQEERLREVALWNAVNRGAIQGTRPWIVTNEEDIWFTRCTPDDALYVFLTRQPDWPRGERRDFRLSSVRATDATEIQVLGHDGKIVEYSPTVDPTPRWEQTDDGLVISVVRAQRLYNNHKWNNPLVVRLTGVEPALGQAPYAETTGAKPLGDGAVRFTGQLVDLGDAERVRVGFEYQVYAGFAEAMHNTEWKRTELLPLSQAGSFSLEVKGLEPGRDYQYRAVVQHPRIRLRGDYRRVKVR